MSNKTPGAKDDATASALRTRQFQRIALGFGSVCIFLLLGGIIFSLQRSTQINAPRLSNCPIKLKNNSASNTESPKSSDIDRCINLEKATTEAAWQQGLSGRSSMPDRSGMLFVFETPGPQCMWMKDMLFSLDMVWLNQQKEIVKIEHGLNPNSYPHTFCSDQAPAQYVIELNNGVADKAGLVVGQKLFL